jgi:3,4-dihydroxy 2-butanone 4-phosphate synthase/GTP cyclohydrolase II
MFDMPITASTQLNLKFGLFNVSYHRKGSKNCVSFSYGDIRNQTPIVRLHSSCLFGEVFLSKHCDCRQQIEKTLKAIRKHGSGVIIYSYAEGRGIGLENKIKAMELERTCDIDTVNAFLRLGFKPDLREYGFEIGSLKDLNVSKNIILVSNNLEKIKQLEKAGFVITRKIKLKIRLNRYIKKELFVKNKHLGYYID